MKNIDDNKAFDPTSPFPHKQAFSPIKGTYLNAGLQHPISRGCAAAVTDYMEYKGFHKGLTFDPIEMREKVKQQFAELINASPNEVTFVSSTTVGENLIIKALDIEHTGGRIVTDDLHYFGSYQIYGELKKLGIEVLTIRNKNGTIDYADYEAAINDKTTLVAVSSVSTFNGHQHDLKKLCDIAHKHGAYVYADSIHHIGATPFDVRNSGVDFCSSGSFKWLMADQGLGFIYVRSDVLKNIKRPWFGKRQVKKLTTHVFPGDQITDDDLVYEYELAEDTEGYFSIWSEPRMVIAQLLHSLDYLLTAKVERITEYRQPLLRYLRDELTKLGFKCLTPPGSITPLLSFECENKSKAIREILAKEDIQISVYKAHFRVAISVYNDMDDMIKLVATLKQVS